MPDCESCNFSSPLFDKFWAHKCTTLRGLNQSLLYWLKFRGVL